MGPASLGSPWETAPLPAHAAAAGIHHVPLGPMTSSVIARRTTGRIRARAALLAAPILLVGGLAACSSDATPEPTDTGATTSAPSPTGTSPSPDTSPSRIVAVLCDEAAEESQDAIRAAMLPDYTVSQLVDVRTDDDAQHAILGFVEGPGLAVLAQWVGDTLELSDLTAADEFAAQVSTAPLGSDFPQRTQDLLDNTVKCYTTVFGPDDDE